VGSSYLPSDILAAYLSAQLENAEEITSRRIKIWECYHRELLPLDGGGLLTLPHIPEHCQHNAHMYYMLLANEAMRDKLIAYLKGNNISTVFHYFPLHLSPAGKKYGRVSGTLRVTEDIHSRLLRLPLWLGLESEMECVIEKIKSGIN
jgi:dTDP-4-amino-4,6-dideoxygalactose transaminase